MDRDQTICIRLRSQELKALDDLRRKEEPLPSKSEMVRRLIARAERESDTITRHEEVRAA